MTFFVEGCGAIFIEVAFRRELGAFERELGQNVSRSNATSPCSNAGIVKVRNCYFWAVFDPISAP